MFWDSKTETMEREELERLEYRLLKTLVYRLYSFSAFYHRRMEESGVHPDDVKTLGDAVKLPSMFERDLRDNYPDKLFTATKEELVRYHVSSGTTGKPTVVASRVTRTSSTPSPLIVPAKTGSPGALSTGRLSPVTGAWFTAERPAATTPSAGNRDPGLAITTSSSRSWSTAALRCPLQRGSASSSMTT